MQDPLNRLRDAVTEVRKIDPEMPSQILLAFLWIAQHEGTNQTKMREALNLSISQTSRISLRLSDLTGGLGLVTMTIDPDHRSHRQLWLTPNGKRLVGKLQQHLEGT